jgi:hypothetical protein
MSARAFRSCTRFGVNYSRFTRPASTISQSLPSIPISVQVSPQEVASQSLTWRNLELATRALHRDGLVVLEDVIDHSKLDFLNRKMMEDAQTLRAAGDKSPYNYNKGSAFAFILQIAKLTNLEKEHPAGSAHG